MTAGIDWASADHAVCVVGAAGVVMTRFTVEHTAAGLAALVRGLARAGATVEAVFAARRTEQDLNQQDAQ